MVGAVTGVFRSNPDNLVEALQGPFTALPTIIFAWSREVKDEFRALTAAAIVVLVVLVLVVNATAIILRNRYDKPW
jgi:phosphate transport system permease protein